MVFFWHWSTWAQLSFVLGCLLAIVFTLAIIVRHFNHRKQYRLRILASDSRSERGELHDTLVLSEKTPFGLSAIGKEPEIEGLWNSRTTTPLQTPIPSPTSSREHSPILQALGKFSHHKKTSTLSSVSGLDISDTPMNMTVEVRDASAKSSQHKTDGFDGTRDLRDPSTKSRFQHKHEQSWHSKSSDYRVYGDSSAGDSTSQYQNDNITSRRPDGSCQISGRDDSCSIVQPLELMRTPSTLRRLEIIDRLDAHRQAHAAEQGQLKPRIRHSANTGVIIRRRSSAAGDNALVIENQRSLSWPMSSEEVVITTSVPKKPQRRTGPLVVPLRASIETDAYLKVPPSAWTSKTQAQMDDILESDQHSGKAVSKPHGRSYTISSSGTFVDFVQVKDPAMPSGVNPQEVKTKSGNNTRSKACPPSGPKPPDTVMEPETTFSMKYGGNEISQTSTKLRRWGQFDSQGKHIGCESKSAEQPT